MVLCILFFVLTMLSVFLAIKDDAIWGLGIVIFALTFSALLLVGSFIGLTNSTWCESKLMDLENTKITLVELKKIYREPAAGQMVDMANKDINLKIMETQISLNNMVSKYNLELMKWQKLYSLRAITLMWWKPADKFQPISIEF